MKKKTVIVHDLMQTNYRYELTQPMGKHFDPEFKPELTPKQMLRLGVFGGKYTINMNHPRIVMRGLL